MTLKEMKMLKECYKREVEDMTHWSTESERRLFFATLLFNLECEIKEIERNL